MSVPPGAELCVARYVAQCVAGHVIIVAFGVHHVAGCEVFLWRDPDEAFPPRYSLWHFPPRTPPLHVVTGFAVCAQFQTTRAIDRVEVNDAEGTQTVLVEEASERLTAHEP